jgi:hypothetical protein
MTASVPSIPRPTLPWPCPATLMGVARRAAIKAVKRQMVAQGLKPTHIEMRIIAQAANDYLAQHREQLILDAADTVRNVAGFRTLAEREARERRRNQRDRDSANNSKPNTTPQAKC